MKKKKYLPLYEKWMKSGKLPEDGLCNLFVNDPLFELIDPGWCGYWGYDGFDSYYGDPYYDDHCGSMNEVWYDFTPLRQNIVLLMAALNGEL